MTFEECKEKYPIGSYLIVKHKTTNTLSWFQVQDYIVCVNGPFSTSYAYPSWRDPKNGYEFFNPERYDVINVFPTFKDAEPYISRI